MKTSMTVFFAAFAVISATVAFGYSVHTSSRVRELEYRLQRTEAVLGSRNQSLADTAVAARIRRLEERVQRAEAEGAQVQSVASGSMAGLEQRVQNVEHKIEPHLETIPAYVPNR
jgi:hypothetical protein